MKSNYHHIEEEVLLLDSETGVASHQLVLYNDDITPFNYVIESLMTVCKHAALQAEQCTLIAHNKGRAIIKIGNRKELVDMQEALALRFIQSEVESIS